MFFYYCENSRLRHITVVKEVSKFHFSEKFVPILDDNLELNL